MEGGDPSNDSISNPVPRKTHSYSHTTSQFQYHEVLFMLIYFEITLIMRSTPRTYLYLNKEAHISLD